jgi:acetyl esterase/lipase
MGVNLMKSLRFSILYIVFTLALSGCAASNSTLGVESTISEERSNENIESGVSLVGADTKVMDVINHPAFEGYGRFLFPTERGMPNENMRLDGINSLLPFHQNVNANTTITVVNHMLEMSLEGETIFYDIYTEEEKQANPSRENTGLFFFRGEPGAPFAIVCAGGGWSYVGSIHESFPLAIELTEKGYNAFAIQYRTGGASVAREDLAAAISFVFANSEELQVSTEDYSLWGGSAGARMAAYLGSHGSAAFGGDDLPRPAAVIMLYTGHTDYTVNDPPTFAAIGENDGIASWRTMESRVNNLRAAGIDAEFHLYRNLGHGFGLGIATTAEGWLDKAADFWGKHIQN